MSCLLKKSFSSGDFKHSYNFLGEEIILVLNFRKDGRKVRSLVSGSFCVLAAKGGTFDVKCIRLRAFLCGESVAKFDSPNLL